MNLNVFVNCPFDDNYVPLFEAILFSIYFCGFKPRCALEVDDASQNRLEKIYSIIEECDLGIHDISRIELNLNNLPRFNMPLEFGIFLGAKRFGGRRQKSKMCMVFDSENYRYQQFISDIAGQDIKAHNNNPEQIIRINRNWFNSLGNHRSFPGANAIIGKFNDFLIQKPQILQELNLTPDDVQYADNIQIIEEWIKQSQI